MRAIAGGLVVAAALAAGSAAIVVGAPIDPARLPPIATPAPAAGESAAVFATGADADLILYALGTTDFAAIAGGHAIDGRVEGPATAAFDAVANGLDLVRLHRASSARGVDVERHAAPALEVLRELADDAATSYVFAPGHVLPAITIRAHHVDALVTARAVAALLKLELVEVRGTWAVVEPGTQLAPATVTHTHARSRLEINHAHPGEARRLLEPAEPQARNLCPVDTWVDASLHGQVGVLEAVLDTLAGPPCDQHPNLGELDTGTASLVGILVEAGQRRAVFRVPGGARAFEPNHGERVEIKYVLVHGDSSELWPKAGPEPIAFADDLKLRATVRVGARWTALLRSPGGDWRIAPSSATLEVTAGSATAGDQTFVLER